MYYDDSKVTKLNYNMSYDNLLVIYPLRKSVQKKSKAKLGRGGGRVATHYNLGPAPTGREGLTPWYHPPPDDTPPFRPRAPGPIEMAIGVKPAHMRRGCKLVCTTSNRKPARIYSEIFEKYCDEATKFKQ